MLAHTQKLALLGAACAFLCFSLAFLSVRNLYEDELFSFELVPRPVAEIWSAANSEDVHPPGMYVLSHFFFRLTHSERWMTVGPILFLCMGLAFFGRTMLPLFARDVIGLYVFLALLFLHPQLLMWGNSIRWYPYWTALGLVALSLCINETGEPPKDRTESARITRWAILGLVLGTMFYLNYLTVLFAAAVLVAFAVARPISRELVRGMVITAIIAGMIAAPQAWVMLRVHLPGSAGSQRSSLPVSAARLFHGELISEAMMPWSLVGLAFAFLVALPLLGREVLALFRSRRTGGWSQLERKRCFALAFLVALSGIASVLGLGVKPRSFIVVTPVLALSVAMGLTHLKRAVPKVAIAALVTVWIAAGGTDLLRRQGTAKGGLNDRLDDVEEFLRGEASPGCNIVFTHDPGLAYVLNRDLAPSGRWAICSTYPDWIHGIPAGGLQNNCQPETTFVVKSFAGSLSRNAVLPEAVKTAEALIAGPKVRELVVDPDIRLKRLMPGPHDALPEFRFTVEFGPTKTPADLAPAVSAFREVWQTQDRINRQRGVVQGKGVADDKGRTPRGRDSVQ